jgi:hypothetical protein
MRISISTYRDVGIYKYKNIAKHIAKQYNLFARQTINVTQTLSGARQYHKNTRTTRTEANAETQT